MARSVSETVCYSIVLSTLLRSILLWEPCRDYVPHYTLHLHLLVHDVHRLYKCHFQGRINKFANTRLIECLSDLERIGNTKAVTMKVCSEIRKNVTKHMCSGNAPTLDLSRPQSSSSFPNLIIPDLGSVEAATKI